MLPGQRGSLRLHQAPLLCKSSTSSKFIHPTFKTNSSTHFIRKSMWSAYGTSRVMIRLGWSTSWTGCVFPCLFGSILTTQHRLSTFFNPPVLLLGSVCASSGAYAAIGGYSQYPIHSRFTSWTFIPGRSPLEILAMCTKGLSTVQGFVSNVSRFLLRMIQRELSK